MKISWLLAALIQPRTSLAGFVAETVPNRSLSLGTIIRLEGDIDCRVEILISDPERRQRFPLHRNGQLHRRAVLGPAELLRLRLAWRIVRMDRRFWTARFELDLVRAQVSKHLGGLLIQEDRRRRLRSSHGRHPCIIFWRGDLGCVKADANKE